MPGLKLNEHYTSMQGEGPRTGVPTQFLRFSGCNMRCPGWPCDTQHAIQPELYRNDPRFSSYELVIKVDDMRERTGATNVCITGGEPFMQNASEMAWLIQVLCESGYTVDVFTNGSFELYREYTDRVLFEIPQLVFIMDWKLTGSGERDTRRSTRLENAKHLRPQDAIKFVMIDEDDFNEAVGLHQGLIKLGVKAQFWAGVAWGHWLTNHRLVELILEHKLPWRLNVQTHKHIWAPQARGV